MLLMEFIFKVAEDVGGPRKEFLRIALKSAFLVITSVSLI